MTVMIVDDSASIREILRSMLSQTADSFCECTDGSEALEAYRKFRPDWVLMDIKMKHTDGFHATQEILAAFPDARVIMVTQYDDPKLQQMARRVGAIECILKERLIDIERIISGVDE